jgi:ABC-2 type transport system ATP-binding protein
MPTYAIQTHNLGRDFGKIRALDQLSINVPSGSIFGFLGPNGSGKTTTIRLLLGLLEPNRGSATVLGFDIQQQADDIRQNCGALLEHHGLYERISAADNLEYFGRIWHIPANERRERIKELLNGLGLWDRRMEITGEWSRGMKQKLAIARTLLHRPRLVFMDEPTAGLDPVAAASVREDLATLAEKEGVTVFLTTHNLTEAETLCQELAVIRQGKLLAVGTPAELRSRKQSNRLEISGSGFSDELLTQLRLRPEVATAVSQNGKLIIGLRQPSEASPIISLILTTGASVEEVHKEQASLEEVFLTLMEEDK